MPTAVNAAVASTINVNISDVMLRYARANLVAALSAIDESIDLDASASVESELHLTKVMHLTRELNTVPGHYATSSLPVASSAVTAVALSSTSVSSSAVAAQLSQLELAATAVPCWIINETGEVLHCWVDYKPGRERADGGNSTASGATDGGSSSRVTLQPGESTLMDAWHIEGLVTPPWCLAGSPCLVGGRSRAVGGGMVGHPHSFWPNE